MAITQAELQNIISAVLSSIRTNSRTIDQLATVTTLSDTDCIEINGGKKVTYRVLRELIVALAMSENDTLKTLINKCNLKSVSVTADESTATLTISSIGKSLTASIPIATRTSAGLMTAQDKKTLDSAYESAQYAQASITSERNARQSADDALRDSISDEQSARFLADGLLRHDIDTEISQRKSAVETLEALVSALRSDLGSEASVRAGADNELRASIALLRSAIDRLEHDLDGSEDGSFAQSVNEDIREAYSRISSLADDLRSAVDSIDDNAADISHLTPLLLPSEEEHTRLVETGKIDPEQIYYTVEED